MNKIKLSAAIATFNEEPNIARCLESIKDLVDEIVIVDGTSMDKTVEIAKKYGAKIEVRENLANFHVNKQRAFDLCKGEWILYLDGDEQVSKKLGSEIKKVTSMSNEEIEKYQARIKNRNLFLRHQKLLEKRDGGIGTTEGNYAAFFFPRLNVCLGSFLRYGGVYPDGVIRLFKRGQAYLPAKDVHEQMVVKGKVGWLENDLLHYDSPTFKKYKMRNDRYINLLATQLKQENVGKDPLTFVNYLFSKPLSWFIMTQIRHKGILDGIPGIIFSFFSALRFPRAYLKYLFGEK